MVESSVFGIIIISIVFLIIISSFITYYMPLDNFRDVFFLKSSVVDKNKAGRIMKGYYYSSYVLMAIATFISSKFDNIYLLYLILLPGLIINYFSFKKYYKSKCCK